jgi:hypothetical protein
MMWHGTGFFRFLLRENKPKTPTKLAKSGNAAGRGTAVTEGDITNDSSTVLVNDPTSGPMITLMTSVMMTLYVPGSEYT